MRRSKNLRIITQSASVLTHATRTVSLFLELIAIIPCGQYELCGSLLCTFSSIGHLFCLWPISLFETSSGRLHLLLRKTIFTPVHVNYAVEVLCVLICRFVGTKRVACAVWMRVECTLKTFMEFHIVEDSFLARIPQTIVRGFAGNRRINTWKFWFTRNIPNIPQIWRDFCPSIASIVVISVCSQFSFSFVFIYVSVGMGFTRYKNYFRDSFLDKRLENTDLGCNAAHVVNNASGQLATYTFRVQVVQRSRESI